MSNSNNSNSRELSPMAAFREQLEVRLPTIVAGLPSHITPQQFKSVLIQAVMSNGDLLNADPASFFEAALAAANDGLLPDKREGAMVIYNTKIRGKEGQKDRWIKKVQWMPMIRGIITKIHNTGQVKSVSINVVYGGDSFRYWTDDQGEHLFHEPAEERDKDTWRRVYALVIMNNGGVFAEVMDADDVDKLRQASKNPDTGPWATWYDEMAKKGVFRRLFKRMPISREIQQVLDRDNYLYDIEKQDRIAARETGKSIASRLDDIAGTQALSHDATASFHTEDGKEPATKLRGSSRQDDAADSIPGKKSKHQEQESQDQTEDDDRDAVTVARDLGRENREKGMSRKAIPAEYRKDDELSAAYLEGFDGGDE